MSDLQAIADRVEIEALCGEFTDAVMMRDYDRFASLFTGRCLADALHRRHPRRPGIRAEIERMQGLWEFFVQRTHPGPIQLEGDAAAVPMCPRSGTRATAARN
jgi:hypothetical protein